ncbi:DUF998 domain-containing protein [Actinokineospora sp. 24-640]
MTNHGGARTPRAMGVALGFTGLVLSAVFMAGLHLVASGQINPIESPLSGYVFVDGYGWMFGASVVGMAVGGVGVLIGLWGTAVPSRGLPRLALGLAAVCCLLVALFPTNKTGPLTLSAEIHRYAAGVAFVCVPIAALLVAAHLSGSGGVSRWLRRTAFGTALLLVVFLTSHFGVLPEEVQRMSGLFQRIMFALQLVTIAQLLRVPATGPAVPAVRLAPVRGRQFATV